MEAVAAERHAGVAARTGSAGRPASALEATGPAEVPPKRIQIYRMCQWLADRHGIPFRFPDVHPFRSIEALRLLVALDARVDAVDALFDAVFRDGLDLGDPANLEAFGRALGLDHVAAVLAAPTVKDRLRANTDAAIARGVFGVPTVEVGAELFWGFDTIGMIDDYLANPGLFRAPAMARLEGLGYGVPRRTTG
ncbi:2-hydroxychromene-2-carboxylate isomerase [Novosphingobium sp. EMRT-2]|uniref:2-hydroxychromene-2-carboxylate isomerase n=1 Tax=Novosphingobium sp. EMRT-2 TaxID=2571749 RepID=UPI003519D32C